MGELMKQKTPVKDVQRSSQDSSSVVQPSTKSGRRSMTHAQTDTIRAMFKGCIAKRECCLETVRLGLDLHQTEAKKLKGLTPKQIYDKIRTFYRYKDTTRSTLTKRPTSCTEVHTGVKEKKMYIMDIMYICT